MADRNSHGRPVEMMLAGSTDEYRLQKDPHCATTKGRPRLRREIGDCRFAALFSTCGPETMTFADVTFLPEDPAHETEIEAINAEAFGPGRFTRAAYKIREGGPHERALSFVAVRQGEVIASVKMTRVAAGEGRGLMLGPLAVKPAHKNLGIGRHLVKLAVEAAAQQGWPAVILVGDEPYYGPLGFKRIPRGQVSMPRPVDLDRVLAVEITPGAVARLTGMIDHEDRLR